MKRHLTMLERSTCIKLLKSAKNKLKRYEEKYICDAIAMSERNMQGTQVGINMDFYLREWVMSGLGGYVTYGQWLTNKYPKKVTSSTFTYQVRQARIAWVEWMINELESGR